MELILELMELGAPGPTFCSALKFKAWYGLFVGEIEEVVKHEQIVESEMPAIQKMTVFEVEAKSLHSA